MDIWKLLPIDYVCTVHSVHTLADMGTVETGKVDEGQVLDTIG